MAKVTGPLYSLSASGKIANAMVHFPWKGLAVVRQWLKPTNPRTENQGDIRLILGGLGRATKPAADGKTYQTKALECAVAPDTWVSALVKYLAKNYMHDGASFESQYSEYAAHTAKSEFDTKAAALGLTDFDISYKGTTHKFVAGLQLYMTAKYGCQMHATDNTKFNVVPYTTALASWDSDKVDAHAANMTT
jgi:hypothetical protein